MPYVYAPCDVDFIMVGVNFCYVGLYKTLDTLIIEVFSVFFQLVNYILSTDGYVSRP